MKAIYVDFMHLKIEGEVEVESKETVDDMYYKTDKGMIPIAYLIKPEHKGEATLLMEQVKVEKARYEKFAYNCFTQIGKLRI